MKQRILIAVSLLFAVGGCNMPTETTLQEWIGTVNEILPAVKEVQALAEKAAEDGLLNKAEVANVSTNIDQVIADVERVNEAIAAAETPEEAVSNAIEASRPFNPYADEMNAALGLIIAVGGIIGGKKLSNSNRALEEVVIGVEDAKKAGVTGGNDKGLNNYLIAAESMTTRKKVKKILNT